MSQGEVDIVSAMIRNGPPGSAFRKAERDIEIPVKSAVQNGKVHMRGLSHLS